MLNIRSPENGEIDAFVALRGQSFAMPAATLQRARSFPVGELLIAELDGKLRGSVRLEREAAYFGGAPVPTGIVSAVAVSPEARGRGVGTALIRHQLRSAYEQGLALVQLHPTSAAIYRHCGYELFGVTTRYGHPVARLPMYADASPLVPWGDECLPTAQRCYQQFAMAQNGPLERSTSWWSSRLLPHGEDRSIYRYASVRGDGTWMGYLLYELVPRRDERLPTTNSYLSDLVCHDFVWNDLSAATDLLSFLAAHRATSFEASWLGTPEADIGPLFNEMQLLPQQVYSSMGRIIDVVRAFTERRWPEHLAVTLELDIVDPDIAENAGAWSITLERGRCDVARCRSAQAQISIGGLSALYAGALQSAGAQRLGLLHGVGSHASNRIDAVFAGSRARNLDWF